MNGFNDAVEWAGASQDLDENLDVLWIIDAEPFLGWDELFASLDMTRCSVWTQGQIEVAIADTPDPKVIVLQGFSNFDGERQAKMNEIASFVATFVILENQ